MVLYKKRQSAEDAVQSLKDLINMHVVNSMIYACVEFAD